jgi:cyclophilin family peptidyl-prolyl cis-trans isomerase/HEAT repeat protein
MLADHEGRVRRRAALAIGRVGLRAGVAPLIAGLSDPEPEVRQMAAFALGLLADREAGGPLRAALADGTPLVRGRAAEALGAIGDRDATGPIAAMIAAEVRAGVLSRLAPDDFEYLASPAAEPFRLGVNALVRLKAYDALASVVLDAAGQPVVRWWPVAWALQRLADKRSLPALLTFARGPGELCRMQAARGLGALRDPAAVDVLVPMAQAWAGDPRLAVTAVRSLGQIGDSRAVPALLRMLGARDLDAELRVEVVTALGALQAQSAGDVLLDLLSDPYPPVRIAALQSLRALDGQNFLAVLSGLDADRDWSVRAAISTIMGSFDAETALPRLQQALKDPDPRVIPPVLAALARLRAPGADATFLTLLGHDDAVIRAAATAGLGEMKPQGAADRIAESYKAALRDPVPVARAAALRAIVQFGAAPALPLLRTAAGDPDWSIRLLAAGLLGPIAPTVDAAGLIRPAPTQHDRAWYGTGELVSPSVSPHVFLDTNRGIIEIELAVLDAPITAATFLSLARAGFYNGLAFHRVVSNFVVQAGDPRGDGEGGAAYTIRDEINDRPCLTGAVGMALDGADTGGSQFFITRTPQPHLDGRYTIFGSVVAGMDVVGRLRQWDTVTRVRVWDGVTLSGDR